MPLLRTVAPAVCLAAALALGPALAAATRGAEEVVVKAGETLSGIAKRHGVALSTLVSLNGIGDANRIFAGQRLRISTVAAPPPVAPPSALPPDARIHTVAAGDNLWSIARFYGISLSALIAVNEISDASRLRVGISLTLPRGTPPAPAPPPAAAPAPPPVPVAPPKPAPVAGRTHTVVSGENLWSIARFYGVSLSALTTANGISDGAWIRVGLRLTIPGATTPPAVAPAAAPAPAPTPPSSAPAMPTWMASVVAQRAAMRQLISEEASAADVPVAFALAVAWQESGWRQEVVSSAGAVGVMQLMPGTARWIGEVMLGREVNVNDARDNVRAGVRLLAHYLSRYGGNRDLALAAYYQGQGAADRHGIYPVSRSYIASITALVGLFGG